MRNRFVVPVLALALALAGASWASSAFAEDEMKPEPAPGMPGAPPAAGAPSPGDLRNSRFFDTHDANLDGKVTKDEYTGDATVFDLFDLDKDGVISLTEVGLPAGYKPQPMAKPMDEQPGGRGGKGGGDYMQRAAEFKKQLVEWDTDKDGKVSKEEYKGRLAFDLRDRNKDGVLTMDDMGRPGGAGGMPVTPEQAMERFKQGDKNGDGKVTKDEFVGAPERFDVLDRNKDGAITPDEVEAGMKDAMPGEPGKGDKSGRRMFRAFDKNGDGKVTREEFPGGDAAFKELDKNGDGAVSEDELPATPPKDLKKLGKAAKAGAPVDGKPGETPPDAMAPTTPPAEGLPSLFAALDKDRDGRLCRAEFSGTDDEWRRLDKDSNGWITPDEAK